MNESIVLDINSNVDGNKDNVMVKTSMYRKVSMKIYMTCARSWKN